jgi:hypothetical protein
MHLKIALNAGIFEVDGKTINLSEEIEKRLDQEGLLIRHKDPKAKGVVPFNVGLLPWKTLDVVAMADTWQETQEIMRRAQNVLSQ